MPNTVSNQLFRCYDKDNISIIPSFYIIFIPQVKMSRIGTEYILKLNSHNHLFSLPEVCTTFKSSHINKCAIIHHKVSFSDGKVTFCTFVGKSQTLSSEVQVTKYYDNL